MYARLHHAGTWQLDASNPLAIFTHASQWLKGNLASQLTAGAYTATLCLHSIGATRPEGQVQMHTQVSTAAKKQQQRVLLTASGE